MISPRSTLLSALFAALVAFSIGCPGTGSTGEPDGGTPEAEPDGGEPGTPEPGGEPGTPEPGSPPGDCPEGLDGSNSVCDTQNQGSDSWIGEGVEFTMRGVVATTPDFYISDNLRGFFVADDPNAQYGGVLVTMLTTAGVTIATGDIVDVTGTVKEFSGPTSSGTETQVEATTVTLAGGTGNINPLSVADIGIITDPELGEPFEGVLITIDSVAVDEPDLGFGQWSVTDGTTSIVVDNDVYSYTPATGEVLGSITGILRYSTFDAGQFVLLPRSSADVVSDSRPRTGIPQLLDPTTDGYIAPCPEGQFGGCGNAILENMVVTSEPYFITNGSRGPLFGFFVADPEAVDADGRLLPYSGVLCTMSPEDDTGAIERNDYDFTQEDSFPFDFVDPDAIPKVGDVVNVRGQNSVRFGMPQFRFVSFLEKVGTVDDVDGVDMPLPAQFDPSLAEGDERHPSRLFGGRPEVSAEAFGAALASAEIAPDPAVTSWLGVLVEIVNAQTIDACYGTPFNPDAEYGGDSGVDDSFLRDFGYFKVSGDVEVGGLLERGFAGYWDDEAVPVINRTCENLEAKCADSRVLDQTFTALTGFMDISFDVYRLNPRSEADFGGVTFVEDTCGG